MKKNKFLVYLLSTALITPTFATQQLLLKIHLIKIQAQIKWNNIKNKKKHQSNLKKMNLTTMILNTILMIKSTSDSKDKDSNKSLSADSTDRNYKMKDDNLVDQLYDNFKSQSVDFSKYWEPNKYEDSFSLTSLIQNLFDFDSDITDYEQPQKTNHSSNDEKIK